MMMKNLLPVIQIILSVFLMAAILLQAKGTGLGSAWAGGGEFYRTKRGAEKILFYFTFILIALFLTVSIVTLIF